MSGWIHPTTPWFLSSAWDRSEKRATRSQRLCRALSRSEKLPAPSFLVQLFSSSVVRRVRARTCVRMYVPAISTPPEDRLSVRSVRWCWVGWRLLKRLWGAFADRRGVGMMVRALASALFFCFCFFSFSQVALGATHASDDGARFGKDDASIQACEFRFRGRHSHSSRPPDNFVFRDAPEVQKYGRRGAHQPPSSPPSPRCFSQPPDPVFPSLEDPDEKLVLELVEGERSRSRAQRVLQELSGACKEASVELEVLLQVGAVLQ